MQDAYCVRCSLQPRLGAGHPRLAWRRAPGALRDTLGPTTRHLPLGRPGPYLLALDAERRVLRLILIPRPLLWLDYRARMAANLEIVGATLSQNLLMAHLPGTMLDGGQVGTPWYATCSSMSPV